MASYQSDGKSLVALLQGQIEAVDEKVLSPTARRCLKDYGRHLQRKVLGRDGDHLAAGLLLNAAEIVSYIPSGKLGKGSVELTRLQERVERAQPAMNRSPKRKRRSKDEDRGGRKQVPTATHVREPAGYELDDETEDHDAAQPAEGQDDGEAA